MSGKYVIDPKNSHRADTSVRVTANLTLSPNNAVLKSGGDPKVAPSAEADKCRSEAHRQQGGSKEQRLTPRAAPVRLYDRKHREAGASVIFAIHPGNRHEMRDLPEKHDREKGPPADGRPRHEQPPIR